ncbi:MAG: DUF3606 domain-containing protein [Pseudomonadota bacterium]
MSHDQATQRPLFKSEASIDVHQIFDLVCWARHFGVAQQQVRDAVKAVGTCVSDVAFYLQARKAA